MVGDQRRVFRRRHPSRWLPSIPRHANREDAEHHEHEVERAHREHRVGNRRLSLAFEVSHQVAGQRPADHRAPAKTHDRKPRRQARPVREPLDQRRYRRDISQPQSDTANHTIAQVDEPELVAARPKRRDDKTHAKTTGRIEHRPSWTGLLQPCSKQRSRDAEKRDGNREDIANLFQVPG